jgi:hypothetical protein
MLDLFRAFFQFHFDYVTRRFNASSAGLKYARGADPSLKAALRDLRSQQ